MRDTNQTNPGRGAELDSVGDLGVVQVNCQGFAMR
jgi:hypothetical protein